MITDNQILIANCALAHELLAGLAVAGMFIRAWYGI
jgi:hypothetical protein